MGLSADEGTGPGTASIDGVYYDCPGIATVKWEPADRMVLVEWQGWANSDEFAALLEAGVKALAANSGSRWLADCRLQRVLNPTDQDRADREWLPRALAAGLRRFAIVLPESGLAAANIKDRQATLSARLDVGYFATAEEARRWVTR